MQHGVHLGLVLQSRPGPMVHPYLYSEQRWTGLMTEIAIINKDWTRQATISPDGPKSVSLVFPYEAQGAHDRWLVNSHGRLMDDISLPRLDHR
jgi:hypothetical protein